MIVEWQTQQTWGANGECNKCGYTFLRITEFKKPGTVIVDENGFGQFSFITTYEWCCTGCNTTGPASNIDNS